jgi:hypothetical protein
MGVVSQRCEENRLAKILSIFFRIVFTRSRSIETRLLPSLFMEMNENLLEIVITHFLTQYVLIRKKSFYRKMMLLSPFHNLPWHSKGFYHDKNLNVKV